MSGSQTMTLKPLGRQAVFYKQATLTAPQHFGFHVSSQPLVGLSLPTSHPLPHPSESGGGHSQPFCMPHPCAPQHHQILTFQEVTSLTLSSPDQSPEFATPILPTNVY